MWESIKSFFRRVGNAIIRIVEQVINFFTHVVSYFKRLFSEGKIKQGRDTPFIIKSEKLKQMVHEAPEINAGIFQATYNEYTEEVENVRCVEGDLDEPTRNALNQSNNGIVTLS